MDEEDEEFMTLKSEISDLTFDLINILLTNHKLGVVFQDLTFGTSGQNLNHLLIYVLKSLQKPWEHKILAKLVINALRANPGN